MLYKTKEKKRKLIQHAELFKIMNGKGVNRPELLLYSKKMPVAILKNQCTPLEIVNRVRGACHGVVVPPDSQ